MSSTKIIAIWLLVGSALCPRIATAQSASANGISFQGALTGAVGQPLANGSYNLTFKFMPSYGYAATVSYVIVVLVMILSFLQFAAARERRPK